MRPVIEFVEKGGPVMIGIIALSVILYSRCFKLLLSLRRSRRLLMEKQSHANDGWTARGLMQEEAQDSFRQERIALGAMIAAAPLLGLLGTVSGMAKTFESLSGRAGEKSMDRLAGGISEVLVATESGLAVAIPALLFVYLAHREVHQQVQQLNQIDASAPRKATP
jgi:biopolymer transport protein ExbB/TolQ